jgi:hypothetical protein
MRAARNWEHRYFEHTGKGLKESLKSHEEVINNEPIFGVAWRKILRDFPQRRSY